MPQGRLFNVLLVEDNIAHAKIISHILKNAPGVINITHLTDGDVALDYVHGRGGFGDRFHYPRPELILLDLRMPRLDGIDVLKGIKADDEIRIIPVVVLTTSNQQEDVNTCYRLGANAYVVKPLEHGDFLRRIREIHAFWTTAASPPNWD
jgi:CheY-like chemotaxis protein